MNQDQNQQQSQTKKQKSIPFTKKLKRAKRHFIKFLKNPSTIQAFYFCIQAIIYYIGIASLLLLIYYFFYQSFVYFIIVLSIFSLFYVSYQGVNIIHYKTIAAIQNFQGFNDINDEAQKEEQKDSKGWKYYCQFFGITIASLLLLDFPILNFQIVKQVKQIDDQLKIEDEQDLKRRKQASKAQDKSKQPDINQLNIEYGTKINSLKNQKKQRISLIPYKFGCSAIFGYVPVVFILAIWQICNQQQIDVFGKFQNMILTSSYAFLVCASIICLYEIQFFDKTVSNLYDATKWFLCRLVELLCKSLLIGYYIKFSLFQTTPLLIIGLGYLFYSIFCTFIFTLFDYEKKLEESQLQSERQDQEQQEINKQENLEVPIEKGLIYIMKCYLKSFFLNIYARTLFLPYKESALGMKTLSFFQITYGIDKKMIREEVAPETWKNIMVSYDQLKKFGLPRRSYTHIVQSLRFFEFFHLALFCTCQNIIQGQYLEIVEPKKLSLYYSGKILTVISIIILLFYYIRAGHRTIYEKQLDITGIDE
ncbi:unnamed protein product [Paramecium sonneborni]|uniref:Transmembrane protein n=1 Tax=Paramecium sonneborni TaxID=65129 RepID=A0A8S1MF98_9CILI|nr:unnamed protein product [Paramecium sonneborni]